MLTVPELQQLRLYKVPADWIRLLGFHSDKLLVIPKIGWAQEDETAADGGMSHCSYDLVSMTDQVDQTTTYKFDARQRLAVQIARSITSKKASISAEPGSY
jgi:hypothetical protein